MNGAQIVAEILKREGTEFLSCYPRNTIIEPCAALGIRPILCRQERVGVGLADGYSRIKRGNVNGVFAAQAGPGIENAFPGVAQAYAENVPLLIVSGGLPLARQYVRPVFRAADVYRQAGITNPRKDVDCVEMYVPFSWFEPMWLENLGFA